MDDDERRKLVSTEQSLEMDTEPRLPSSVQGLESFSLSDPRDEGGDGSDEEETQGSENYADAESFFNLPDGDNEDEDDDSDDPRR